MFTLDKSEKINFVNYLKKYIAILQFGKQKIII
jgi:hypothetical protein